MKKKNSARKKFTKSKKKNDKKVKNLNVLNWSAYKMSRSWKRKQDCFVQFFLFHFCYFNRSFLCSQAVVEIVVVVFISPFKSRLCWFALARFAISSKLRAKQAAQIEWQKAIRIENLRIKRKKKLGKAKKPTHNNRVHRWENELRIRFEDDDDVVDDAEEKKNSTLWLVFFLLNENK